MTDGRPGTPKEADKPAWQMYDSDAKFTTRFDRIFEFEGIHVKRHTPDLPHAPSTADICRAIVFARGRSGNKSRPPHPPGNPRTAWISSSTCPWWLCLPIEIGLINVSVSAANGKRHWRVEPPMPFYQKISKARNWESRTVHTGGTPVASGTQQVTGVVMGERVSIGGGAAWAVQKHLPEVELLEWLAAGRMGVPREPDEVPLGPTCGSS